MKDNELVGEKNSRATATVAHQVKMGENSCISNSQKIKMAFVENMMFRKPENGHTYVVYRKHELTGEPTYSICIYMDGNWIPEVIKSMNIPNFNGIPACDDDMWIDLEVAFMPLDEIDKTVDKTIHDIITVEGPKEPDVTKMTCREYLQHCVDKREAEELKRKSMSTGIKKGQFKAMSMEHDHDRDAIKRINERLNDMMDYIDKRFLDNPAIEQNWSHVKELINGLIDRVSELERRHQPLTTPDIPLVPNQPYQPYTPYPTVPSIPAWPYNPIVTYSVPGGGIQAINTTIGNNK